MNIIPRQVLRQLLADYGLTLLGEPARLDALLADLCGSYPRERFLLVHALRERIPIELQNQSQGGKAHELRLSQRLQRRYGFSTEAAQWAVESWFIALNAVSPEEDLALTDEPFTHVEEVMLQILAQEPLSSHQVATVLKTTQQQAVEWLNQLQELGRVESIWLKHRSPHYAFYKVVSSEKRIAAEVAARKTAEKQLAEADLARKKADKRAVTAREEEQQKLSNRMEKLVAARQKAERRAVSAERRAEQESPARKSAERRADQEATARKSAERRADQEATARKSAERRADQEAAAWKRAEQQATTTHGRLPRSASPDSHPHRHSRSHSPNSPSKKGCFSTILLGLNLLTLLGLMIQ